MSLWSSIKGIPDDKIDVAIHSYNGLIRVLCMNYTQYEELTIDEAKELIIKLGEAIQKTETPS